MLFKFIASAVTSKKTQHLPSSVEHMPSLFFQAVFQVCAILGMVLKTGYWEKEEGKIQMPLSSWRLSRIWESKIWALVRWWEISQVWNKVSAFIGKLFWRQVHCWGLKMRPFDLTGVDGNKCLGFMLGIFLCDISVYVFSCSLGWPWTWFGTKDDLKLVSSWLHLTSAGIPIVQKLVLTVEYPQVLCWSLKSHTCKQIHLLS